MSRDVSPAGQFALTWIKSSHRINEGGECVEVAHTPSSILIRDSKVPTGPRLPLTPTMWTTFLSRAPQ